MRTIIQELRSKPESTYAVTETGTFKYHRMLNDTVDADLRPEGEVLADESTRPTLHGENENVLGSQYGGRLKFTSYAEGLAAKLNAGGSPAGGGVATPNTSVGRLITAALGTSRDGLGTAVKVAGTTSTTQVEVDDPSGFDPMQVIGVTTNCGPGGTPGIEPAVIRKIVGDVLHLFTTLASAPADGSEVVNSETFWLDPSEFGANTSLYFELVGEDERDRWKVRGCHPVMTIDAKVRQLLKLGFDFRVNNSSRDNGLAINRVAPVGGHPLPVVDRVAYFADNPGTDAAVARNILQLRDVTIDPGLTIGDEGGGGVQTLYGMKQLTASPVADVQFQLSRGSAQYHAFHSDLAAHTKKYTHYQYGQALASSGRGGIFFVCMPNVQYDAAIGRAGADGFVVANVKLGGMRQTNATGATTHLADSPIIIAQL